MPYVSWTWIARLFLVVGVVATGNREETMTLLQKISVLDDSNLSLVEIDDKGSTTVGEDVRSEPADEKESTTVEGDARSEPAHSADQAGPITISASAHSADQAIPITISASNTSVNTSVTFQSPHQPQAAGIKDRLLVFSPLIKKTRNYLMTLAFACVFFWRMYRFVTALAGNEGQHTLCKRGHRLEATKCPAEHGTCDLCDAWVEADQPIRTCAACNWVVCRDCSCRARPKLDVSTFRTALLGALGVKAAPKSMTGLLAARRPVTVM